MSTHLLHGKKILITQNSLHFIGGSEIVTLELADYFQSVGAEVIVFTWSIGEPMETEFKKRKIQVTTNNNDKKLLNPDYVWVHHQVLPVILLQKIQTNKPSKLPIFIFNHMSALDSLYLEQPYIPNLEKSLASLSLFNSEESLDFNIEKYPNAFNRTAIFPNPFPDFFLKEKNPTKKIDTILVVSNHPPEELKEACKLLSSDGINTIFLGQNQEEYKAITPAELQKADVIITIGKTVQYCLASNIPVYIYDHFGGCGYLNSTNHKKASYHNFSGRGFRRKDPNQIQKEILDNYQKAIDYQINNKDMFIKKYSLSKNISNILSLLPRVPYNNQLTKTTINSIISTEYIARDKIIIGIMALNYPSTIEKLDTTNQTLKLANKKLDGTIKSQQTNIASLKESNQELRKTIESFEKSRAVKIARFIHDFPQRIKFNTSHFTNTSPEILLVMCVYNESTNLPLFLKHLEKYIDGIVVLDDNSTDNTIQLLEKHPKLLKIVKKDSLDRFDEKNNRETILRAAKQYAKTANPFVLCIDPDERLETNLLKNLRKIARDNNNKKIAIEVNYCELWNSPNQYRVDGIWGKKVRTPFFQLSDQMTFSFPHRYHVPWIYDEIMGRTKHLDYNIYHLKMIRKEDRTARKKLYNSLDPNTRIQSIGYDYLDDENGLKLKQIPKTHSYDTKTVPKYYTDNQPLSNT